MEIKNHISIEDLGALYCEASEPVKRSHYQIIWLLAKGHPTREVAELCGYSLDFLVTFPIHWLCPEVSVALWAFDEHRLGLKPVKRRCWTPVGSRLVAPVPPRYQ